MKKIRYICILLVLSVLIGFAAPHARALDDPGVDTTKAVILVAEKGSDETVLYTKNADERMYPASLTKIMTVLLAIEAVEAGTVKLTDMVTAQPGFDFDMIIGGSSVYMVTGETMSLENLLYCAMVASANEVCNVIAEYVDGSISGFVEQMNLRAAELGCVNTHFTNTHGLPDANHYTTARDFVRILKEASNHELFMEISNTIKYVVPDTNMAAERTLENTNSLINPTNPIYPGDYGYEYARGVKTGHTSDAGYCLATTAEKDDVRLLCILMGSDSYTMEDGSIYYGHFADARRLFQWAFDNFSYREIVKSTEIVADMPVIMGADAQTVAIRPSVSINALLPNDVDVNSFERAVTLFPTQAEDKTSLTAPVSAGQTVGEIRISINGQLYGVAPLVTSTSVELSRVQFMKGQLAETLRRPAVIFTFWTLMLLFFGYLGLVIRYRLKRRAYQRRLAAAKQIRLDLEDEEDELRYERRVRSSAAAKQSLVMEPESYRKKQEDAVDEPTRVTGETVPVQDPRQAGEPDAPAEAPELPAEPTKPISEPEPPAEPTKVVNETEPPAEPTKVVTADEAGDGPTRSSAPAEPPAEPTREMEIRDPMEEPTRVNEPIDPRETSRAIPRIPDEDDAAGNGSGPRDYYSEFFENKE